MAIVAVCEYHRGTGVCIHFAVLQLSSGEVMEWGRLVAQKQVFTDEMLYLTYCVYLRIV